MCDEITTRNNWFATGAMVSIACMLVFSANANVNVYLTASDGSEAANSFTNCINWSDGRPAHSDADYFVLSNRTMRTSVWGGTFEGNSLTIGSLDEDAYPNCAVNNRTRTYVTKWGREGLVLAKGYYYEGNDNPGVGIVDGKVTVIAPDSAPFRFGSNNADRGLDFIGDFHGAAGTGLLVGGARYGDVKANFSCRMRGDMSDYLGTITVTNIVYNGEPLGVTFIAAASSFPGTVCVRTNALLKTEESPVEFGTLNLDSGACVTLSGDAENSSYGTITARNAMSVGESISLKIDFDLPSGGDATQTLALVTAPLGSGLSVDKFVIDADIDPLVSRFAVIEDETAGMEALAYVCDPVVRLNEPDSPNANTSLSSGYSGAIDDGTKWSDGFTPRAGRHYVIPFVSSVGNLLGQSCLRTRTSDTSYTFPGMSLTLNDKASVTIFQTGTFKCDMLRMESGSILRAGSQRGPTVDGVILAESGTVYIGCYCNKTMTIASDIVGAARVVFQGYEGESSARLGTYELTGDNSRFTGTMTVATYGSSTQMANFQTLVLSSAASLGAPLASLDRTALKLSKWGRLTVNSDVTLSTASNRGLAVSGNAQLNVTSGKTFSLGTALSLDGRLVCSGAGTFAVGGAAGFGADGSGEPETDKNVVEITNGTVRVTSASAVDGVTFKFLGTGALELSLNPADAELTRYGIKNVRTDTPFAFADGVASVPFSVDVSAMPVLPRNGATFGVLTVADAATNAVEAVFSIPKSYRGFRLQMVKNHDNENGWTTYAAEYLPTGAIIIFK